MLVKLTDHKGKVRWINAAYIKALDVRGEDSTKIMVSGWSTAVRVDRPIDEIADQINAAMPDMVATMLAAMDSEAQDQAAAAAAAAM